MSFERKSKQLDAKETSSFNYIYHLTHSTYSTLECLWLWLWFLCNHFVCQTYLLYFIWIWINIMSPINLLRSWSGINFDHVMSESYNRTSCVFAVNVFCTYFWSQICRLTLRLHNLKENELRKTPWTHTHTKRTHTFSYNQLNFSQFALCNGFLKQEYYVAACTLMYELLMQIYKLLY